MTVLYIYKLEDLKQTQAVAKLPIGEYPIGRGGILNCTDRRVSHNHAIIIITEDKVTLKSVHINPCFYKAAKGKIVVLVKKDESVFLSDGDQFALVADTHWFKIRVLSDETSIDSPKEQNQSEDFEAVSDKDKTSDMSRSSDSCLPNVSKLLNASLEGDENKIDTVALITNLENIFQEDFGHTEKIIDKEDSNESTDFAELLTKSTGNSRETEELVSAVTEKESSPEKEESKVENADISKETTSEIEKDQPEKDLGTVKTEDDEKRNSDEEAADTNGASTSADKPNTRRERCWYGASCYRKNPVHRSALSHPGDDDYESDPNEDQPVCPYGASCYRTNLDHRRVYKHSAPPSVRKPAGDGQPKQSPKMKEESSSGSDESAEEDADDTRKRRKRKAAKKVKKLNETPEDDYDFDDPFLNDASGDDFEPSDDSDDTTDWEDSQCVDEESQERKRLLKEAKKFTKAKKRKKT